MEGGNEIEIFIILTKYNIASSVKKVTAASGDYLVYFHYFLCTPPNRQYGTRLCFKVGPGTVLKPRYVQRFQKCLESHRHSPQKGCLRCQVINLASPRSVKVWEIGYFHPSPHNSVRLIYEE